MQLELFGGDDKPNKPKGKPTRPPPRPITPTIDIPVNSSVETCDLKRLSRQGELIYRALLLMPRLNLELSNLSGQKDRVIVIQNLTARLSEIRKWLKSKHKRVWSLRVCRMTDEGEEKGLFLYGIGDWKPDAKSHRLIVPVKLKGDRYFWDCPRCGNSVSRAEEKTTVAECQKHPLCSPCGFYIDNF